MELIDRLRYIMKLNQLSASAFADEIGVQRSSVSHVLSGRNKPSLEFIHKILKAYPKVDANWLINGTTKMEQTVFPHQAQSGTKVSEADERQLEEDTVSNEDKKQTNPSDRSKETATKGKKIERILIFYSDQSFEEYKAGSIDPA